MSEQHIYHRVEVREEISKLQRSPDLKLGTEIFAK
jgi:hypothetical protein